MMKLCESVGEDITSQLQEVNDSFNSFSKKIKNLCELCKDVDEIKSDSILYKDFFTEECKDKLQEMSKKILDLYSPKDFADDEDDIETASVRYRASLNARKGIVDDV